MFTVSADILILGFIAGFVLFKLFSVLGRKDDDGEVVISTKDKSVINMVDISPAVKGKEVIDLSIVEKNLAPGFEKVLEKIRVKEQNFSLQKFLEGAKTAFEMVLLAFAENDRATLKDLLDGDAYKQFIAEIDLRKKNKVVLELTLVALPVIKIENIEFANNKVSIDVMYGSQQINIIKNDKGDIIEGNASQIDHMEDVWSFEKSLNSRGAWKLVHVNAN